MSTGLLNRLATQRASCKHWCALLTTAVLLAGAIAKLPLTSLLWAAAPIFLLGLTEASYAGQEARYAEALSRRRGEGETGRRGDVEYLPPELAGDSLVRTVRAALSPAIWPFYLGMFAIVSFGAVSINEPVRPVVASARGGGCGSSGCGSGGGCGSSGGMCGGSSSGRGCGAGCGSGAATISATNRPTAKPGTAQRPGFVPVNSVQVNRPVTPAQPGITISPQTARPAVSAPISVKVVPVSPQPVRNAGGTATPATGVTPDTPSGSTPPAPDAATATPPPVTPPATSPPAAAEVTK